MDAREHGEALERFADFRPTALDARGLGSEGQEDWRVLPLIQTRDSEALERSNFEVAQRILNGADVNYAVHRFGHWGPGWFEIIVVEPTDEGLKEAGEIVCSLEDYPVLDDDHFSELEANEAWETWQTVGFDAWYQTIVRDFELREPTDNWLQAATKAEKDLVLWTRDNHSGDTYGSGTWDVMGGMDRWDRDQLAGLLRKLRQLRKDPNAPVYE